MGNICLKSKSKKSNTTQGATSGLTPTNTSYNATAKLKTTSKNSNRNESSQDLPADNDDIKKDVHKKKQLHQQKQRQHQENQKRQPLSDTDLHRGPQSQLEKTPSLTPNILSAATTTHTGTQTNSRNQHSSYLQSLLKVSNRKLDASSYEDLHGHVNRGFLNRIVDEQEEEQINHDQHLAALVAASSSADDDNIDVDNIHHYNNYHTYGNGNISGSDIFSNGQDQQHIKGIVGLSNLGNTCFMNSSLQCLSNTIPLTDYFLGYRYKKEINRHNHMGTRGELVQSYAKLIKHMWLGNDSTTRPSTFKAKLETFAPQFRGTYQQDAQELLAYLLDGIHEDLNRVQKKPYIEDVEGDGTKDEKDSIQAWHNYLLRDKSIIVDIFQGQLRNTLTCNECHHKSVKFDPFMYLSIPLSKHTHTLDDCFDLFCQTEELKDGNQWYCSKCKKLVNAMKKIDLWTLPPILIIHMKRFEQSECTNRVKKLNNRIQYPVKSWCPPVKRHQEQQLHQPKLYYDLYAVSNHVGSVDGGHYTAMAMNRLDDQWYEFNDSRTTQISENQVKKNSNNAYLLFYNRMTDVTSNNFNINNDSKRSNNSGSGGSSSDEFSSAGVDSSPAVYDRIPMIFKQSVSRPEHWPHLQQNGDDDGL